MEPSWTKVEHGILEAIRCLWPGGIPDELRSTDRNHAIEKWHQDSKPPRTPPSVRTIQATFKKLREGTVAQSPRPPAPAAPLSRKDAWKMRDAKLIDEALSRRAEAEARVQAAAKPPAKK